MDGVIIDSEKPKIVFLKKTLNNFGIQLYNDQFQEIVGQPVQIFLAEYLKKPALEEKIWQIFRRNYLEQITKYVSPIRATVEFIKEYKGSIQLGIASNGIQKINEKLAKHFGIFENLSVIVSREAVINLKPAPDLYLKAAELLNVDPVNCVAIEDTVVGAQSAIDAQMQCFIFLNDYNKKRDFANLNISGFIQNSNDIKSVAIANV